MAGVRKRECSCRSGLRPSTHPIFIERLSCPPAALTVFTTRNREGAHECESLLGCCRIDLLAADDRSVFDAVEGLPNELRLRYSALTGPSFQHLIVTLFDIDLFPNHRSWCHTS